MAPMPPQTFTQPPPLYQQHQTYSVQPQQTYPQAMIGQLPRQQPRIQAQPPQFVPGSTMTYTQMTDSAMENPERRMSEYDPSMMPNMRQQAQPGPGSTDQRMIRMPSLQVVPQTLPTQVTSPPVMQQMMRMNDHQNGMPMRINAAITNNGAPSFNGRRFDGNPMMRSQGPRFQQLVQVRAPAGDYANAVGMQQPQHGIPQFYSGSATAQNMSQQVAMGHPMVRPTMPYGQQQANMAPPVSYQPPMHGMPQTGYVPQRSNSVENDQVSMQNYAGPTDHLHQEMHLENNAFVCEVLLYCSLNSELCL